MKVVVYTLTDKGEVPSYIIDGGYFAKANELSSPQDFDLVGLASDEATELELASKAAVIDYVSSFIEGFEHPTTFEVTSVEDAVGAWCDVRGAY